MNDNPLDDTGLSFLSVGMSDFGQKWYGIETDLINK